MFKGEFQRRRKINGIWYVYFRKEELITKPKIEYKYTVRYPWAIFDDKFEVNEQGRQINCTFDEIFIYNKRCDSIEELIKALGYKMKMNHKRLVKSTELIYFMFPKYIIRTEEICYKDIITNTEFLTKEYQQVGDGHENGYVANNVAVDCCNKGEKIFYVAETALSDFDRLRKSLKDDCADRVIEEIEISRIQKRNKKASGALGGISTLGAVVCVIILAISLKNNIFKQNLALNSVLISVLLLSLVVSIGCFSFLGVKCYNERQKLTAEPVAFKDKRLID
ncbi:MAG: hypothetical protein OEY79_02250 [Anaplasmataceae bacterium]|nr:hypothetical protein [Anaplasmataceae bacterium]